MHTTDLSNVLLTQFPELHQDLSANMITYNSWLHEKTAVRKVFAWRGAPWEFNLRDVLRWAQLSLHRSGFEADNNALEHLAGSPQPWTASVPQRVGFCQGSLPLFLEGDWRDVLRRNNRKLLHTRHPPASRVDTLPQGQTEICNSEQTAASCCEDKIGPSILSDQCASPLTTC